MEMPLGLPVNNRDHRRVCPERCAQNGDFKSTPRTLDSRLSTPDSRLQTLCRSPNIAVPMRKIVAPSSIAISKSWVMPIESSP